jgi:hypothetical protein
VGKCHGKLLIAGSLPNGSSNVTLMVGGGGWGQGGGEGEGFVTSHDLKDIRLLFFTFCCMYIIRRDNIIKEFVALGHLQYQE